MQMLALGCGVFANSIRGLESPSMLQLMPGATLAPRLAVNINCKRAPVRLDTSPQPTRQAGPGMSKRAVTMGT